MFLQAEIDTLHGYLNSGKSLLFLFNEGGEQKNNSNLNYLLEQYGISVNNDCVIRTSFYKYLHPKENLIQAGILDKEIIRVANNQQREIQKSKPAFLSSILKQDEDDLNKEKEQGGLDFVYPYGASLNVQEPSFSLLSSGPLSYPINRPLMGVC
jgi:intraflagellar transport protein 52